MRVLIVGAGVIGTAAARDLARRGAEVVVVDRGEIGHGCSYGNAGWLTPCFATPLPAPGVLTTSLGWLLDPESPLHVRPYFRLEWLRWIARFAASTGRATHDRGVAALVPLSKWSLEAWSALDRERPGSFGFAQRGLALVALTAKGLASAKGEAEHMGEHGIRHAILGPEELKELEPSVRGEIAGGIFFPDAAHCEPLAAVRALAESAREAGATFLENAEVYRIDREGSRIAALHTTRGVFRADRYVLAAGAASKSLGKSTGLRVPVLGGKGFSIVVKPFDPPPTRPVKILERRIAVTPRDGSVRLGGTLELVDGDESLSPRRIAAIVNGSRSVLAVPDPPEIVEIWRGLRPCTPTGLPILAKAPGVENLVLATGHQMCGLHTAPASGRLVADLVLGENPTFDPEPFRR